MFMEDCIEWWYQEGEVTCLSAHFLISKMSMLIMYHLHQKKKPSSGMMQVVCQIACDYEEDLRFSKNLVLLELEKEIEIFVKNK